MLFMIFFSVFLYPCTYIVFKNYYLNTPINFNKLNNITKLFKQVRFLTSRLISLRCLNHYRHRQSKTRLSFQKRLVWKIAFFYIRLTKLCASHNQISQHGRLRVNGTFICFTWYITIKTLNKTRKKSYQGAKNSTSQTVSLSITIDLKLFAVNDTTSV